jgi:4-aminobutyrate aminotransferase-like enzyme
MRTLSQDPPLAHVTTFGGHPVCCAAGLASLRVILDEDLTARAERTGRRIREELRRLGDLHGGVRDVRGLGMLIGLELESAERTRAFAERAFTEGVIIGWTLHSDTVIRLAPPLNISDEELDRGLSGLATALRATS